MIYLCIAANQCILCFLYVRAPLSVVWSVSRPRVFLFFFFLYALQAIWFNESVSPLCHLTWMFQWEIPLQMCNGFVYALPISCIHDATMCMSVIEKVPLLISAQWLFQYFIVYLYTSANDTSCIVCVWPRPAVSPTFKAGVFFSDSVSAKFNEPTQSRAMRRAVVEGSGLSFFSLSFACCRGYLIW